MTDTDALSISLIDGLPVDEILARYQRAPGNELESTKFSSPESSAALVANTFGLFLKRARDFPLPPDWGAGSQADRVLLEEELRFLWSGGRHPWLDVVLETQTHLIGIESKRYEPYRTPKHGTFSDTYLRPAWGKKMVPYEWLRDGLATRPAMFQHLDAVQLVKHGFGIRTQAHRRHKQALLVYLYAEPKAWPDGRLVPADQHDQHAEEARCFARLVEGAEVGLALCSYRRLLAAMLSSPAEEVRAHAAAIGGTFDV
jgi:hypothetical protein